MLLDRIDIDAHGPLNRVEVGPLSEHVNVIVGPEGAGKTAIARFIRDSLVNRQYPLGMMSSSTGRVVWADQHGLVHCRREQDGTPTGRRTVEFESRGEYQLRFDALERSWIDGAASTTDASMSLQSIQLPESIVDGVITDTSIANVARVASACIRAGLDNPATYRDLPLRGDSVYGDRQLGESSAAGVNDETALRSLRSELADVEAELARLESDHLDTPRLQARRGELADRLARMRFIKTPRPLHENNRESIESRLAGLVDQADRLRLRQADLRRWIADLDTATGREHASRDRYVRHSDVDVDLRRRLDDIDGQMIRWRRTLAEVRGLRESIEGLGRTGYSADPVSHACAEDLATRRRRLDGFLDAIDRHDGARGWDDFYGSSYQPQYRRSDVESRIDSATRQIEWLLERYTVADTADFGWIEAGPSPFQYRSHATLAESLRAIRDDLRQLSLAGGFRPHAGESLHFAADYAPPKTAHSADGYATESEEMRQCERWLVAAIDRLARFREKLISETSHRSQTVGYGERWTAERAARQAELDRVTAELSRSLSDARELRIALRSVTGTGPGRSPLHGTGEYYTTEPNAANQAELEPGQRDAIVAELRAIDDRLASRTRIDWLRTRRSELMSRLSMVRRETFSSSPLADAASHWLVRLSAGRLRRVSWPTDVIDADVMAAAADGQRDAQARVSQFCVQIDGRNESDVSAADRALATTAVRMAAADLLSKTGRPVPLVIELHNELLDHQPTILPTGGRDYDPRFWRGETDTQAGNYADHGEAGRFNHPIAAAFYDFAQSGHQLLILTSSEAFGAQVARAGGRRFDLFTEREVQPHRPLWRSQYAAESYVGPHPHTYGPHTFVPAAAAASSSPDINRDFDCAWREAYGLYDAPERVRSGLAPTDWAPDGVEFRDGYYFAETVTSNPQHVYASASQQTSAAGRIDGAPQAAIRNAPAEPIAEPERPFFLNVDSPVDQAPSIDGVAAARLRGLGITHINHLMQQDSNRLSDTLGLGNVNAAVIRRWQNESRMMCRVPQLRGFDARVLVGCGLTDPAQLAAIHPSDLLDRVEGFFATERGQRILLSGTSYELSRITSWIATANRGLHDTAKGQVVEGRRVGRDSLADHDYDNDRYEYAADGSGRRLRRRSTVQAGRGNGSGSGNGRGNGSGFGGNRSRGNSGVGTPRSATGNGSGHGNGSGNGNGSGHGNGNGTGTGRPNRNAGGHGSGTGTPRPNRTGGRPRSAGDSDSGVLRYERDDREPRETGDGERSARGTRRTRSERSERQSRSNRSPRPERAPREQRERALRFYLQRDSEVEDAPSIGSRMAERLGAIGIFTVNDLLTTDAATIARKLDNRRVDEDIVLQWQQQATLVCRVPMLRGHDAQLLVAADITTAEQVAQCDPEGLLDIIDPIARSRDGKRILRGGKLPDLEEITEWVDYAGQNRALQAA